MDENVGISHMWVSEDLSSYILLYILYDFRIFGVFRILHLSDQRRNGMNICIYLPTILDLPQSTQLHSVIQKHILSVCTTLFEEHQRTRLLTL